jgi:hypothetical protein
MDPPVHSCCSLLNPIVGLWPFVQIHSSLCPSTSLPLTLEVGSMDAWAEAQSCLLTPHSHLLLLGLGWLGQPDSSPDSRLHIEHNLKTVLSIYFRWFFYWGKRWDKGSDVLKLQVAQTQRILLSHDFFLMSLSCKHFEGEGSLMCKAKSLSSKKKLDHFTILRHTFPWFCISVFKKAIKMAMRSAWWAFCHLVDLLPPSVLPDASLMPLHCPWVWPMCSCLRFLLLCMYLHSSPHGLLYVFIQMLPYQVLLSFTTSSEIAHVTPHTLPLLLLYFMFIHSTHIHNTHYYLMYYESKISWESRA